ncbi:MAG: transglutaminase domain-containing protein [Spirochaetaceae bacterium]|jgi:hypothetical protein|nr:transglutaminase domain-containing protein [Spirochaetaceae bacterium]
MNKIIPMAALGIAAGLAAAPSIGAQTLAIDKAEALIDRYVTSPGEMRDRAWENAKGKWDSVELIDQRELPDGRIEYTLKYSVDQRTRIYTTETKNTINGPKNVTVAKLGPLSGPNENLSAHDAERLIAQCKEWYRTDADYRRIIDILEREVVTKLQYDWQDFLGIEEHTYEQALRLGVGVCDVYASLVVTVLTKAGYTVEKWSSETGSHAWNRVIMRDGRILYIDATWYDNNYDNHPSIKNQEAYEPYYITYDRSFFEHGYHGTINMHGGWPDAVKK